MLDAKAEVDTVLRQGINDFTAQFVNRMMAPIKASDKKTPLKLAPGDDAAPRIAKLRANIDRETPFLRTKLEEYITDSRTREMLVAAVMESVAQTYEEWYDVSYMQALNGGAGRSGSGKGKGREDGVWDPDMFGEWCGGVFRVGTMGLGILGGDGEVFDGREGEDMGSVGSVGSGSLRTGNGTERSGTTGIRIKM